MPVGLLSKWHIYPQPSPFPAGEREAGEFCREGQFRPLQPGRAKTESDFLQALVETAAGSGSPVRRRCKFNNDR